MRRPLILVAEDEETEVFFLRRAMQKAGVGNPLAVVSDGEKAIEYLNGDPPFNNRELHPFPALLLLDLKMPIMTGFDVLSWMRQRPEFKALPVVVLTSSSHALDQKKARELGAADYKVKPSNVEDLVGIIHELHARWLNNSHNG